MTDATPIPDELLPCPHCGGRASGSKGKQGDIDMYYVECEACESTAGWSVDRAAAHAAWNRRAASRPSAAIAEADRRIIDDLLAIAGNTGHPLYPRQISPQALERCRAARAAAPPSAPSGQEEALKPEEAKQQRLCKLLADGARTNAASLLRGYLNEPELTPDGAEHVVRFIIEACLAEAAYRRASSGGQR